MRTPRDRLPLLAALLVGCSAGAVPPTGSDLPDLGPSGPTDPLARPVTWAPCTLYSDERPEGPMAECATLAAPLRPGAQGGPTLPLFVKRFRHKDVAPLRQVALLAGGPGGSGVIYETAADVLVGKDPALEVYLPDHRGTGQSARLSCASGEADDSAYGFFIGPEEWPDCIDEIKAAHPTDLDYFSSTGAAHDLGVLLASVRREGVQRFVLGGSYGTWWAQRYLQLFPDQADGVILDAIVPPDGSLARQDEDADIAGGLLLAACAADPGCHARLGDDPRARALALLKKLDGGHCPALGRYGPPHVLLRRAFGQMMMGYAGKMLIPAAVARAERCNAADVNALLTLLDYYFKPKDALDVVYRSWGWALSYHVTLSEIWEDGITATRLAAWRDAAAVSRDVTGPFEAVLDRMPRYPRDQYVGRFATTATPLLMIQGTWDPATLHAKALAVRDHFRGEHQTWVEIPRGGHGAMLTAPTKAGTSCGTAMILDFMAHPRSPVDTSCLADLVPLGFEATPEVAKLLLGTADVWGGL